MNLGNTLTILLLPAPFLLLHTARAADKQEFCQTLSSLESHIIAGSYALNATNNLSLASTTSECACTEIDESDGSFLIDCSVEENHVDVDNGYASSAVFFEKMLFKLKEGGNEYSLSETSWGRDYDSFQQGNAFIITREEFYFGDDGVLAGCKANACTSCSICDDKTSVAVDCSVVEEWGVGGEKTTCEDGYTGTFVNTFDFGLITGEEMAAGNTSPGGDSDDDRDRDAICRRLNSLESHMNEEFEKLKGLTFTSSYECTCSDLDLNDVESFTINCVMEGAEGHITFVSTEQLVFNLIQGEEFELSRTSWKREDSNGDEDDETFILENGVVASCEARGCTSCSVCDDNGMKSIAVNCTNRDIGFYSHGCSDGYTGSFSHTFFGAMAGRTDDTADTTATTTQETQEGDLTATYTTATSSDDTDIEGPTNAVGNGDEGGAGLNPAASDPDSVGPDSASSTKMGWMAAPAFFVLTGFMALVV
mmetsp:Transcript_14678/g.26524  ORF Transcript_14678/g.26524 Transcript_14678/m.26524 type:complete len:479 (+) Transcript_14678:93-1529(+)